MNGKIVKALSGFYYVKTESGVIYECRAKGTFKNQDITPLVGDNVVFQVTDADERTGFVTEIAYRKNQLIRPAVANVDQAMVVFAVRSPNPNLSILDRFLVLMQKQNIPVIIVFNKKDLAKADDIKNLKDTYKNSGCRLVFISAGGDKPKGLMQLKMMLRNKITVMAGPSGVGKSTLERCIDDLVRPTEGSISLDGMDVRDMSRRELAERIGYVQTMSAPYGSMTVFETVSMGRYNSSSSFFSSA